MIGRMPGFGDYIFIFVLALILFGPKKMPELARQLGKLMGEFRRASNEFKMQMEEEMRVTERAEQEKKVAALEAAAPPPVYDATLTAEDAAALELKRHEAEMQEPAPLEIASEGELSIRPPETGLPVAQSVETAMSVVDDRITDEVPIPDAETAAPATTSSDAVNALADSIPAANEKTTEGHTTHG